MSKKRRTEFIERQKTINQISSNEETGCGMIIFSKNVNNFKLKCFYCMDAFPIWNWKAFVAHINKQHQFVNNNCKENAIKIEKPDSVDLEQELIENTYELRREKERFENNIEMVDATKAVANVDDATQIADATNKILKKLSHDITVKKIAHTTKNADSTKTADATNSADATISVANISQENCEFLNQLPLDVKLIEPDETILDAELEFPQEISSTDEDEQHSEQQHVQEISAVSKRKYKRNAKVPYVKVNDILLSNDDGKQFLEEYKSKTLNEEKRKFLVDEIVSYYVKNKIRMTVRFYRLVVKDIIKIFPEENKDIYFLENEHGENKGILLDTYRKGKKSKKLLEKYYNVKNILTSTDEGKTFLEKNKTGELDEDSRRFLTNKIIYFYLIRRPTITSKTFNLIAEEIVSLFPLEDKETYFSYNNSFKGKLYNVYAYRQKTIKNKAKPTVEKKKIKKKRKKR